MYTYKRTIGITGCIYTREFEKIKHHKNKVRDISEPTVIKQFKAGNAQVNVYFEETGEMLTITPDTDPDVIKKYLGKKFL